MTKKEFNKIMKDIKTEYPLAKNIEIGYWGSGDSFEEFDLQGETSGLIKIADNFIYRYNELLWEILNQSVADFNNEGSRGTIYIDLENNKVTCDVYHIVHEEVFAEERDLKLVVEPKIEDAKLPKVKML